jgi:NADH-quinone oxidoreductase subunit M
MLTWLTFSPLLVVIPILLTPSDRKNVIRWLAVLGTVPALLLSVYIFFTFDREVAGVNNPLGFQYVIQKDWITSFNIQYYMGIDGLSVSMVLLTGLLCFLCIFASWGIDKGLKGYFTMFLLLEVGMLGTFVALDFFLFYVFWEIMLLPMYFLIGIWGGPRRIYAAIKFFLYTLFGSVLMLIAMLALYFKSGHSFNMLELMQHSYVGDTVSLFGVTLGFAKLMFILLFIGFAIKVPTFPFHTWLPDAHVEAPTAISVILAGVLLKMGTYGMMRISFPILPEAAMWFSTALAVIAVINIVYGALCAMAQQDFPADVQPRHDHRHALPLGGGPLRPCPPPRDRWLRWNHEPHARVRHLFGTRFLRGPGSARAVELRQRAADAPRWLAALSGAHGDQHHRHHPGSGVHAVDDAAGVPRTVEPTLRRPAGHQPA